jgi:hypothetical protein
MIRPATRLRRFEVQSRSQPIYPRSGNRPWRQINVRPRQSLRSLLANAWNPAHPRLMVESLCGDRSRLQRQSTPLCRSAPLKTALLAPYGRASRPSASRRQIESTGPGGPRLFTTKCRYRYRIPAPIRRRWRRWWNAACGRDGIQSGCGWLRAKDAFRSSKGFRSCPLH